jgi:hypothetical protein
MLWSASEIEARLYSDHTDLLFTYFGITNDSGTKPPHPADVELLHKFRRLIGAGNLHFLRTHDFTSGAHQRQLDPFGEMYDSWQGVHYEFQDADLSGLFIEMLEKNRKFMEIITASLYPGERNVSLLTAKTDVDRRQGTTQGTKERIRLMNSSAHELWRAAQDFERLARVKIRTTG